MKNTLRLAIVSAALAVLAIDNTATASDNVRVSDIRGSTENEADTKLFQRGFTLVDGKQSGDESFKTYYNGKTRQCVMIEIMDNKVISINPTRNDNCGHKGGKAKVAPAESGNVMVSDIRGSTENGADTKFFERGFVLVDGKQSGEESFKTYYNNKSRQCVVAEIMDNKVVSINQTQNANCR